MWSWKWCTYTLNRSLWSTVSFIHCVRVQNSPSEFYTGFNQTKLTHTWIYHQCTSSNYPHCYKLDMKTKPKLSTMIQHIEREKKERGAHTFGQYAGENNFAIQFYANFSRNIKLFRSIFRITFISHFLCCRKV